MTAYESSYMQNIREFEATATQSGYHGSISAIVYFSLLSDTKRGVRN